MLVQAVYRKLKASLVGKVSEQTIEPLIYPIDWTHNPICLKEQADAMAEPCIVKGCEYESAGETDSLTEKLDATSLTPSATTTVPKVYGTKFIEGKSMETGGSSFDLLAKDAPFDYVVLTDCVFAKELAVPLVNTILCCCGPRTTVICCHEIRDEVKCNKWCLLRCIWLCSFC